MRFCRALTPHLRTWRLSIGIVALAATALLSACAPNTLRHEVSPYRPDVPADVRTPWVWNAKLAGPTTSPPTPLGMSTNILTATLPHPPFLILMRAPFLKDIGQRIVAAAPATEIGAEFTSSKSSDTPQSRCNGQLSDGVCSLSQ